MFPSTALKAFALISYPTLNPRKRRFAAAENTPQKAATPQYKKNNDNNEKPTKIQDRIREINTKRGKTHTHCPWGE